MNEEIKEYMKANAKKGGIASAQKLKEKYTKEELSEEMRRRRNKGYEKTNKKNNN